MVKHRVPRPALHGGDPEGLLAEIAMEIEAGVRQMNVSLEDAAAIRWVLAELAARQAEEDR